jgi:hypothetical protein
MFIWLLAAVVVGGFGLIGHQSGSIRAGLGFVGVVLGLALAPLLGRVLEPALAGMGVKEQIALHMLPGIFSFLVIWLIFFTVGFALHRPVELNLKYSDETAHKGFERANQAMGLFLGLLSGICVFFGLGKYVYRYGYLVTQTTNDTSESMPVKYVGQMRAEMVETGWDKTFAPIDATPGLFYEVADILGILHANPLVQGRAEAYPPFLALSERSEFTDIGGDKEMMDLLQGQPALTPVLNHPKTQAVMKNTEIADTLLKTDLKDFRAYLETGASPRYEDERILGRWKGDLNNVFVVLKRQRSNTSPLELKKLRAALAPVVDSMTVVAYPDGRVVMKASAPAPEAIPAEAEAAAAAPQTPPGLDPVLAQRYGLAGARPPAGATPPPAARLPQPAEMVEPPPGLMGFEGTWTRAEGRYLITADVGGQKLSLEAMVDVNGRLTWSVGQGNQKVTLFFLRAG